jgi:ABC-type uncharacterized transport system substrate-binding protein
LKCKILILIGFLLSFFLLESSSVIGSGDSVAILIGSNVGPYLESRDAFLEKLKPERAETFYLNRLSEKEIEAKVQTGNFNHIYAIGETAFVFAINHFQSKDIVFSSVLNPSKYLREEALGNIRGISEMIPGDLFLEVINEISFKKKILLQTISAPESLKDFLPHSDYENDYRVVLVQDYKDALKYLLTPVKSQDRSIILAAPSQATLVDVFIFNGIKLSLENRIIYPGYFKKMAEAGCLFALSANPHNSGIEAAEIILQGKKGIQHFESLNQVDLSLNLKTAKLLGVSIPEELIRKAKAVY